MKAIHAVACVLLMCLSVRSTAQQDTSMSIHQFTMPGANGGTIRYSDYAGKKILIVNTASLANDKQQISRLQTLQQNNALKLIVIAVPCDDFNNLEPEDSAALILQHYQQEFGVTYRVSVKAHVTGVAIHDLYRFLTEATLNGRMSGKVKENFRKFLLDEQGRLIGSFSGFIDTLAEVIQQAIDQ